MNINTSKPRGFTLVEIMITVAIIALLVTIAVPAWRHAVYMSRNTRFINDSRKLADGVEIFATERGYYPKDGNTGTIPPDLEPYLDADVWKTHCRPGAGSTIGGWWDIETNDSGVGCALGVVGGSGGTPLTSDDQLSLLEDREDDGDFSTGSYRKIRTGGYYLIISEEPVIVQP